VGSVDLPPFPFRDTHPSRSVLTRRKSPPKASIGNPHVARSPLGTSLEGPKGGPTYLTPYDSDLT